MVAVMRANNFKPELKNLILPSLMKERHRFYDVTSRKEVHEYDENGSLNHLLYRAQMFSEH